MARILSDTQQRVIDCLTVFGECSKKKLYDQCAGYYLSLWEHTCKHGKQRHDNKSAKRGVCTKAKTNTP